MVRWSGAARWLQRAIISHGCSAVRAGSQPPLSRPSNSPLYTSDFNFISRCSPRFSRHQHIMTSQAAYSFSVYLHALGNFKECLSTLTGRVPTTPYSSKEVVPEDILDLLGRAKRAQVMIVSHKRVRASRQLIFLRRSKYRNYMRRCIPLVV